MKDVLLVALNEAQTRELAQAISNETCRKILQLLAKKELTESEIAAELSLPLSTVHYNLQQLLRGKLVNVEEFHYSPKGREVNHYKLANQYIIIAPTQEVGAHLRSMLAVFGITGALALVIHYVRQVQSVAPELMTAESAPMAMAKSYVAGPSVEVAASFPIAGWFLLGAVVAVFLYVIIEK